MKFLPSRKVLVVLAASVVISTIGIQASDMWQGVSGSLATVIMNETGPCDQYAKFVLSSTGALCIDQYEASPAVACPIAEPQNELETLTNLEVQNCQATSRPNVLPWRYVSLSQAQMLCARAGKRLITNAEWHAQALTTDPDKCILQGTEPQAAGSSGCVNTANLYDLVGNVWEWMGETIAEGQFNGRVLPESGYVAGVDEFGIVYQTTATASVMYQADYAAINPKGVRGILRGGFFGSRDDGGVFSQNMTVSPDFQSVGIGFRCVQEL